MPKKSFGLTTEEQERLARHPAGVPRPREDWALLGRVARHDKLLLSLGRFECLQDWRIQHARALMRGADSR